MTAFDMESVFNPDFPDYSEETVIIQTALIVNDDGTVTISYLNVPWLDVDDLLLLMGSPAARAEIGEALANAIAEKIDALADDMLPIPFEVAEIV